MRTYVARALGFNMENDRNCLIIYSPLSKIYPLNGVFNGVNPGLSIVQSKADPVVGLRENRQIGFLIFAECFEPPMIILSRKNMIEQLHKGATPSTIFQVPQLG